MEKKLQWGDILFSRVARSNLWGLLELGAKVTLAGPSTLVPRGILENLALRSHTIFEKHFTKQTPLCY